METALMQLDADAQKATPAPAPAQAHLSFSTNVIQLYPGDQCALLRLEDVHNAMCAQGEVFKEQPATQYCVLIGSLVLQGLGLPAERLVWVNIEDRGDDRASFRFVGSANVT